MPGIAGLKALTAAVVGGIGSIPGAMLGGLLIGLAESFVTGHISSTYRNLLVFLLLIAVMLVRPAGCPARPNSRRREFVSLDSPPPPAGPQVGSDEWVARQAHRREHLPSWLGSLERASERVGWWPKLAG